MCIHSINAKEDLTNAIHTISYDEEDQLPMVRRHTSKNGAVIRTAQCTESKEIYIFSADINIHSMDMLTDINLTEHTFVVKEKYGFFKRFPAYKLSDVEKIAEGLKKCHYCSTLDMQYEDVFRSIFDIVCDDYGVSKFSPASRNIKMLVGKVELEAIKDVVNSQALITSNKLHITKEQAISRISSAIRKTFNVDSRKQLLGEDIFKIISYVIHTKF